MDLSQLAVFALASLLTGFSKAGLGGGIGALVTVLLLLEFEAQSAIAISLPMLIVADWIAARSLWGAWDTIHLRRLLPGMVAGVVIGTYVLASTPSDALGRLIGALMLLFVATWPWVRRLGDRPAATGAAVGHTAGTAAGVTSAIAHLGGPPVTAYLLLQRLSPVRYVATTVLIFAAVNLIKVPAFVAAGVFDWPLQARLAPGLLLIPAGVAVGKRLVHRIDSRRFERMVLALLAAGGALLVV